MRAILRGDNDFEKRWLMVRILERCTLDEIWSYIKPAELRRYWTELHPKIRRELHPTWELAMKVWYGISEPYAQS